MTESKTEAMPRGGPTTVEPAFGFFEWYGPGPGGKVLSGWMLLPDQVWDRIDVTVDGCPYGTAERFPRPDVAAVYGWIAHAADSGFRVTLPPEKLPEGGTVRLELTGMRGETPVAQMGILLKDVLDGLPTPTPELARRVVGSPDPLYFKLGGLRAFGELQLILQRWTGGARFRRVLDWGCGCGRLSVHLQREGLAEELFGCDIDGEAVAWCQESLPGGRFERCGEFPPTPYPDRHFDLLIAFSVFTHLSEEAQQAWLAEAHRILAPGGRMVTTVNGPFASRIAFQQHAGTYLASGIWDRIQDGALQGVASDGYYRGTYQTPAYTYERWSRWFEIEGYIDRGLGNHQDVVLLRRREDASS